VANWILGVSVAPLIGVAVGVIAQRVPMPELARSVAAVFLTWVLTTIVLIWLTIQFRILGPDTLISLGFENAVALGAACVAAAILHVALGYAAPALPWLVQHRPTMLAGSIGLYLGVTHLRVMAVLAKLPPVNEL
jgi:hypothetical protein